MKRLFLAACALALGGTTVSCMAADAAMPQHKPYAITIQNFAFSPKTLTVPAGTRVVWTNRDEEPHTVTSAGNLFTSSKALDSDEVYATTFTKPGTYAYYCSIHPMMVGTIIVQ